MAPVGEASSYWMCRCRLTRNFFIRGAGHFEYEGDDAAFLKNYEKVCMEESFPGYTTSTAEQALTEIKAQLEERRRTPQEAMARAATTALSYKRLRPEVYRLNRERFLTEEFRNLVEELRRCTDRPRAIEACVEELQKKDLLKLIRPGIWTFRVFTPEFCALLEEELTNFEASDVPKGRPNTMNRYGIVLREVGFSPDLLDPLVADFVDLLATKLLPTSAEGLDSYRAFTVKYDVTKDGDRDLALHYDNAEVTLNVNIGGDWTGGQVTFFGEVGLPELEPVSVAMARGHAILHSGRELHQAEPLGEGRRHNLIIWCRSSEVRNGQCPMCFDPPKVIPTNEYAHEGFTVPPCQLAA